MTISRRFNCDCKRDSVERLSSLFQDIKVRYVFSFGETGAALGGAHNTSRVSLFTRIILARSVLVTTIDSKNRIDGLTGRGVREASLVGAGEAAAIIFMPVNGTREAKLPSVSKYGERNERSTIESLVPTGLNFLSLLATSVPRFPLPSHSFAFFARLNYMLMSGLSA